MGKLIECVRSLNGELMDCSGGGSMPLVGFETDGEDVSIKFLGTNIWSSEEESSETKRMVSEIRAGLFAQLQDTRLIEFSQHAAKPGKRKRK